MNMQQYPDDLVTLTTAANEFEAGTIIAVLAEAGIDAFAFGGSQFMGLSDLRGTRMQIQVRQADMDRAHAALQQNVADSVDLDWNDVELGQAEDDVPIAHPRTGAGTARFAAMPPIVKLGYVVAVALLVIMVIAAITMLWRPSSHP